MRNATLSVIAGNPPADGAQPSGMNGIIVDVAINEKQPPSVPSIPNCLFQNPKSTSSAATRIPHLPQEDANTGPLVSFARSGIAAHWKASAYQSILDLAEACDVPVRWSCRTGACHSCESGLVSGAVLYGPEPLDKPADGNVLICCSQPICDVVIDL